MMKYQAVNHNFIPKDTPSISMPAEVEVKDAAAASIPIKDTLHGEPQEIYYLREQLSHSQLQINALEEKLFQAERTINLLEGKLDQVSDIEKQGKEPHHQIHPFKEDNEKLKAELKKSQDHIQTLYLILLITVIL